jgi:Domain of unknown function (DUF202)
MANSSIDTIPGRFEVKATASDHFSWLRTRLSVERTMMSWIRTATALIGFGFTIVPVFCSHPRDVGRHSRVFSPRAALPRPFPDLLRRHGSGDFDLGISQGASLPLEPRLCGDRWSDARGEANATARGGDRPHPHRNIRFLCRAGASRIEAQGARKHRPNRQFRATGSTQGASHGEV